MKNALICVALLLCLCAGLSAQYIYNPADTPSVGSNNSWPFNSYTGWRFSFIINAKVLGGKAATITDIAFAPSSSGTFAVPDFQMRMGHTTYSSYGPLSTNPLFDTVLGSTPTEVYKRGPISWVRTANAWSDIGLTSPFNYNGTDNICVELRYNTTSSGGTTTHTDSSINRAYTHSRYSADPFNEPKWYVPIPGEAMGPIHRLTIKAGFTCDTPDQCKIGSSNPVNLTNGPATDFYQIAASLGNSTTLNLGPCSIKLDPDSVFLYSIMFGAPVFYGYSGTLVGGAGAGKFAVPNITALVGLKVYHAAVSYSGSGVTDCSNTDVTELIS